jgi:hypothetical protein
MIRASVTWVRLETSRPIHSLRSGSSPVDNVCGRLPLDVEPEWEDDELFIPRGLKSGRQPGAKFLREPLDVVPEMIIGDHLATRCKGVSGILCDAGRLIG